MKNKQNTKSKLIKKLDRRFSLYIRLKYSDDNGYCECISCGKVDYYKNMHNAHWISRGKMMFRFDEDNCRPACVGCNSFRPEYHMRLYTMKQIERLGKDRTDEMEIQSRQVRNYKVSELEKLIEHYKSEVEKLQNDKFIS